MAIRVLLVDDHQIVLNGFRSLLETQPDVEVVGQATDGRTALQLARELSPDVIVMDVTMPDLNGIETTRRIARDCPDIEVLGLSMHPSRRVVTQMLRAGAKGYLLKTCELDELIRAVRVVASGRTYLSPEIAGGVVEGCVQHAPTDQLAPCAPLSSREREVLQLVAEGKSTKEIASALHVSVKTIEAHRGHIMDKVGIRTIAGLTKYAIREGLTPLESQHRT